MFRKAKLEDSRLFFEWRNDELSRKNSLSSDMITWDDHLKWFEKSMQSPARQLFVYELGSESIGTIRVDISAEGCSELSWQLSPQKRGQGFGKKMLADFIQNFQLRPLCARIKASNIASVKMTEAAGFQILNTENEVQTWILVK